jgi:hypothetical protein
MRQYRAACRTGCSSCEARTPRHTGPRSFSAVTFAVAASACCDLRLLVPARKCEGFGVFLLVEAMPQKAKAVIEVEPKAIAMDKTVADLNIEHFKKLSETETDPVKRQTLQYGRSICTALLQIGPITPTIRKW